MSIARRTFLRGGPATAGGTPPAERTAVAARYPVNRSPLWPSAYLQLSPGAVKPTGWPDREVIGLSGRNQEFSHLWRLS